MTAGEIQEIIRGLKQWGHFVEVEETAARTTGRPKPAASFRGVRKSPNGKQRPIVVDVFDRRQKPLRYHCEAWPEGAPRSRDGKHAYGNPEPTILEMLMTTHWQELDDD